MPNRSVDIAIDQYADLRGRMTDEPLKLDSETLRRIDEWRAKQTDKPSREVALKRLLDDQLRLCDAIMKQPR